MWTAWLLLLDLRVLEHWPPLDRNTNVTVNKMFIINVMMFNVMVLVCFIRTEFSFGRLNQTGEANNRTPTWN